MDTSPTRVRMDSMSTTSNQPSQGSAGRPPLGRSGNSLLTPNRSTRGPGSYSSSPSPVVLVRPTSCLPDTAGAADVPRALPESVLFTESVLHEGSPSHPPPVPVLSRPPPPTPQLMLPPTLGPSAPTERQLLEEATARNNSPSKLRLIIHEEKEKEKEREKPKKKMERKVEKKAPAPVHRHSSPSPKFASRGVTASPTPSDGSDAEEAPQLESTARQAQTDKALQEYQQRAETRMMRDYMHQWYRAMFIARTQLPPPPPLLPREAPPQQSTRSTTAPPLATPPRSAELLSAGAAPDSAIASPIQAEEAVNSQCTSCVVPPPPASQLHEPMFTSTVKEYELYHAETRAEREVEVTRTDISWFVHPPHPSQRSQGASSSSTTSSERQAARRRSQVAGAFVGESTEEEEPRRALQFDRKEDEAADRHMKKTAPHPISVLSLHHRGLQTDGSSNHSNTTTTTTTSGSDRGRRCMVQPGLGEDEEVRALLVQLPKDTRDRVEALLHPQLRIDDKDKIKGKGKQPHSRHRGGRHHPHSTSASNSDEVEKYNRAAPPQQPQLESRRSRPDEGSTVPLSHAAEAMPHPWPQADPRSGVSGHQYGCVPPAPQPYTNRWLDPTAPLPALQSASEYEALNGANFADAPSPGHPYYVPGEAGESAPLQPPSEGPQAPTQLLPRPQSLTSQPPSQEEPQQPEAQQLGDGTQRRSSSQQQQQQQQQNGSARKHSDRPSSFSRDGEPFARQPVEPASQPDSAVFNREEHASRHPPSRAAAGTGDKDDAAGEAAAEPSSRRPSAAEDGTHQHSHSRPEGSLPADAATELGTAEPRARHQGRAHRPSHHRSDGQLPLPLPLPVKHRASSPIVAAEPPRDDGADVPQRRASRDAPDSQTTPMLDGAGSDYHHHHHHDHDDRRNHRRGSSPMASGAVGPGAEAAGEQHYSAMRRESLQRRHHRPSRTSSSSVSPYAAALYDDGERTSNGQPRRGSFEGVPGEYYVQDVDHQFRRVRDPTSDVFGVAGGRVPLYVVHGAPPRRLTPSPQQAATRARSPIGCARFNPYCIACRLKYNLVFVDVHMRPVRWPSPRARGLEGLGDCRMHSGMLLGSGLNLFPPLPPDGRFVSVDYVDVRAPERVGRTPVLVPAWKEQQQQQPPPVEEGADEQVLRRKERHLRKRMKRLLWDLLPQVRERGAWGDYAALLDEGVELLQGLSQQQRGM